LARTFARPPDRLRTDVLGLLREFRMGVPRWPGGNFVSNYFYDPASGLAIT
jgi:alpha-L-arabinofuranosidase